MLVFLILYVVIGVLIGIELWKRVRQDDEPIDVYGLYGTFVAVLGCSILWPILYIGIKILELINWSKKEES